MTAPIDRKKSRGSFVRRLCGNYLSLGDCSGVGALGIVSAKRPTVARQIWFEAVDWPSDRLLGFHRGN